MTPFSSRGALSQQYSLRFSEMSSSPQASYMFDAAPSSEQAAEEEDLPPRSIDVDFLESDESEGAERDSWAMSEVSEALDIHIQVICMDGKLNSCDVSTGLVASVTRPLVCRQADCACSQVANARS